VGEGALAVEAAGIVRRRSCIGWILRSRRRRGSNGAHERCVFRGGLRIVCLGFASSDDEKKYGCANRDAKDIFKR
jgi:hypothetical protein